MTYNKEYLRKYYILNREKILQNRKAAYYADKERYLKKSKDYYNTYVKGYKEGYYEIKENSSSTRLNT